MASDERDTTSFQSSNFMYTSNMGTDAHLWHRLHAQTCRKMNIYAVHDI